MATVQIEYPEILRRWRAAPEWWRDKREKGFGTYVNYLVQFIKREKLSGQVLGKYQGAYDAGGFFGRGQARWRRKPGSLKKTFGAQVYKGLEAQFFETVYGRAWEYGFSRPMYPVSADPARGPRARLMFFWNGKWTFRKSVVIKAQTFPAKPHIRPGISETVDRFDLLVLRPLKNWLAGGRL